MSLEIAIARVAELHALLQPRPVQQPQPAATTARPPGKYAARSPSPSTVVPWLDGDSPIKLWTSAAPSRNVMYQRGIMPPWL